MDINSVKIALIYNYYTSFFGEILLSESLSHSEVAQAICHAQRFNLKEMIVDDFPDAIYIIGRLETNIKEANSFIHEISIKHSDNLEITNIVKSYNSYTPKLADLTESDLNNIINFLESREHMKGEE